MNASDHEPRLGEPRVRTARVDDGRAIGSLLCELGWFGTDADRLVERATHLVPDADDLSRSMLVAELAGEVVGYLQVTWVYPVFLSGPEAYVTELFVTGSARGRSVGSALLDELHRRAANLGAPRVRLLGGRDREHFRRAFYPSRGYERRDDLAVFERRIDTGR